VLPPVENLPLPNVPKFTDVLSQIVLYSTVQVRFLHSTLTAKSSR